MNVRLHPKHGINPTMPVCLWCGEDHGTIALLGAAYPGEAPHRMILDDEPCEKCAAIMAKGITIREANTKPVSSAREVNLGAKDWTGRWCVVSEAFIRRNFQPESLVEQILKRKIAVMDEGTYARLMADFAAAEKQEGLCDTTDSAKKAM